MCRSGRLGNVDAEKKDSSPNHRLCFPHIGWRCVSFAEDS